MWNFDSNVELPYLISSLNENNMLDVCISEMIAGYCIAFLINLDFLLRINSLLKNELDLNEYGKFKWL